MSDALLNGAPIAGDEFSLEQKEYLSGFSAGADAARALLHSPTFAETLRASGGAGQELTGPDKLQLEAQAATEKAGQKLVPEEIAKRERHPLDRWDEIVSLAQNEQFPKGTDVLMWKYHGLFYVAPAQNSFMCRLRFYGGLISSDQLRSVARITDRFGGGTADATTRANLQIREIKAADAADFLETLQEAGLVARGSGADNIRNITGSATAGIDPGELFDTRDLSRQMHHTILNNREMYGLPRKFNIAFDGGSAIATLEDTNDIGFSAVRVGEGQIVPPGVYFRVALGGISGHKDFARDEGLLLRPEECVSFAVAVVRVFIRHGNRTDRKKARLKYLLDDWGHEEFVARTLSEWGREPLRLPLAACEARPPIGKAAHIGWHAQKQEGLHYVGVVLPVGRLSSDQMRGLARLADDCGSGDLRLTVWQNILICDVPEDKKPLVEAAILGMGLEYRASGVRGGLVACTGSAGCKYGLAETKKNALALADALDGALSIDQNINIHVTGCPNSCAQHYIGDIGFLGTQVEQGDDMVDGFHLFVGGGYGDQQNIGREIVRSIAAPDLAPITGALLQSYLATRADVLESFSDWTKRQTTEQLRAFCGA